MNEFKVDDILFEKFVQYSVDRNLRMNFYDYEDSIKLYLKAAIAEQLFNTNIYAKIKADEDSMLQKVKELDRLAEGHSD